MKIAVLNPQGRDAARAPGNGSVSKRRLPVPVSQGDLRRVRTRAEIESAVETLAPREQRELFDFLATKLESQSGGAVVFPDLKALRLAMPDSGEEADFARVREYPRDVDLS